MKHTFLKPVFTALFAAFISIGCFIAIPVGPGGIPIVLQNMLAVLAACILGGAQGTAAVVLFVIAGALGIPVFSGGRGGLAVLTGPTGGFIFGYIAAAIGAGCIAGKPSVRETGFPVQNTLRLAVAASAGFVLIYVPGVLYFMQLTGKPFGSVLAACVIPFVPGDLIKLVLTVPLAVKLRPVAARYLYPVDPDAA